NLPGKVTLRIYNLAGVFVTKLEKDNASAWLDWDLKNVNGKNVASGIYIAHLDMPHIGKKVIKLALVNDK
ncbi:MAG: hypothetical protein KDF60_16355, partial [Calditrichaeota bacterium]|nr:hypothetical protein [Calditrichota bacterium]